MNTALSGYESEWPRTDQYRLLRSGDVLYGVPTIRLRSRANEYCGVALRWVAAWLRLTEDHNGIPTPFVEPAALFCGDRDTSTPTGCPYDNSTGSDAIYRHWAAGPDWDWSSTRYRNAGLPTEGSVPSPQ